MPTYKYTVANQDGKKLSGTVVAPNESLARKELNNLGFSILSLKESKEQNEDNQSNKFIFEAIDKTGKQVHGSIASKQKEAAFKRLHLEYNLTVTAIWPESANEEQIKTARSEGTSQLQNRLAQEITAKNQATEVKNLAEQQKQNIVKNKIDFVLDKINKLLADFQETIDEDQKSEINKKIDKLLRIKNSTNLDYIIKTTEDLLNFIQEQEKSLREKGLHDERIKLKMETKKLMKELNKSEKAESLSEDIVKKINTWQKTKKSKSKTVDKSLEAIKGYFTTPPEIKVAKEKISSYNKQIREFIPLYFKEPTPEYKAKVKSAIKAILQERKKAKNDLKRLKTERKKQRSEDSIDEQIILTFLRELNTLTGWLLAFYVLYYFASLYLNTKDFQIAKVPDGFSVYNSHFFKYILALLFLLHASTALKINFFEKSRIANIFLISFFVLGSLISLLNF